MPSLISNIGLNIKVLTNNETDKLMACFRTGNLNSYYHCSELSRVSCFKTFKVFMRNNNERSEAMIMIWNDKTTIKTL